MRQHGNETVIEAAKQAAAGLTNADLPGPVNGVVPNENRNDRFGLEFAGKRSLIQRPNLRGNSDIAFDSLLSGYSRMSL